MASGQIFGIKTTTWFKQRITLAALLFLALAYIIYLLKPALFFNPNGSFRDFGVGNRDKTIFPIWLAFMVLAIFSYMFVCWLLQLQL